MLLERLDVAAAETVGQPTLSPDGPFLSTGARWPNRIDPSGHCSARALRHPGGQSRCSLPAPQERPSATPRRWCSGCVLLTLKRAWSDGTRALLFEPEAFVERLCALIWKPRVNTVHYHGVFAPGSSWRSEIVPDGVRRQKRAKQRRAQGRRLGFNEKWVPWLSLLSHVFDHAESCPTCGAKCWVSAAR